MLYWFPTPYPDELLYSLLARYHVRSGNTSPKMTTEELFGKRTIRSVWDLPANLDLLLSRIGSYWDTDQLIRDHTMFPYYAAFLLPSQAGKVKQSMVDGEGSTVHTRIGISASNIKPKSYLWTCSSCMETDIEQYGETYWRRTHQAPGVYICPIHKIPLEETAAPIKAENQHEYLIATPTMDRKEKDLTRYTCEEVQAMIKVAEHTKSLLSSAILQKSNHSIREKYVERLKHKELASLNGFLKRDRLYQDFQTMFSKPFLETLQSNVHFKETDWLTMIFQKHRKSFHPIRHILVMMFLDTDLPHLVEEEYQPFGKGPWLCLNPACDGFKKAVVKHITTTTCYDTRKPVGTFRCGCGFVYSRRGPDKNDADRYRIGTIKEYGDLWKDTVKILVKKGYGLMDIARILEADRETIKKYAAMMDIKVPWKAPKKKPGVSKGPVDDGEELLRRKKAKWLELQKKYPNKTKTELRIQAQDVYAFLYRKDKPWLHEFSPVKKREAPVNHRIDWELRDEELLEEVKKVVRNWDKESVKPTKITISAIGRRIHRLPLLQKKSENIPQTMKYINQVKEDLAEFQKRRVDVVLEKAKKENERVMEWEIYRTAGLRPTVSNDVKRYITKKVTEYETVNME